MRVRLIDKNNDFTFGSQQAGYATKAAAVALDIKLRLQEWYGDCFFALQNGIPWKARLGEHNQKELLDADIYDTALNTEGVVAIHNFQSQVIDRRYKASFNVAQIYSTELLPIEFIMRL